VGQEVDNDYPLFLYLYDTEGYHRGSERINNYGELKEVMRTSIKQAIAEKREVRITDTGDLMMFHSKAGHIKWDGRTKHTCEVCRSEDEG
jgi:hypothetical protein